MPIIPSLIFALAFGGSVAQGAEDVLWDETVVKVIRSRGFELHGKGRSWTFAKKDWVGRLKMNEGRWIEGERTVSAEFQSTLLYKHNVDRQKIDAWRQKTLSLREHVFGEANIHFDLTGELRLYFEAVTRKADLIAAIDRIEKLSREYCSKFDALPLGEDDPRKAGAELSDGWPLSEISYADLERLIKAYRWEEKPGSINYIKPTGLRGGGGLGMINTYATVNRVDLRFWISVRDPFEYLSVYADIPVDPGADGKAIAKRLSMGTATFANNDEFEKAIVKAGFIEEFNGDDEYYTIGIHIKLGKNDTLGSFKRRIESLAKRVEYLPRV